MTKKSSKLPTPRVGDRIVSCSMFSPGRRGRRLSGFSDPAKRMCWVRWDDGEVSGDFLKDLVREVDYPKTALYHLMEEK